MNIDINELIKTILDKSETKFLPLLDARRIFLNRYNQNLQTKSYYDKTLTNTLNYLLDNGVINTNQINTKAIQDLIVHLHGIGNKPQTINKKIGSLSAMLNYLSNDLELIDMPHFKFNKLKEDNFEGKILTPEEIQLCYSYIESKSLRIQLVFRILLETGVRRTEATRIKLSNINLDEQTIFLQNLDTKSGKSRYLFIQDKTLNILKEYLQAYKPKFYLFENNGIQFTPSSIESIIYRIKKDLDLNNLSPHILRRSFATYMLDNGANIVCVKDLLGHSTLSQTQKYVLATKKQLQRDCTNFNPSIFEKK